MTDGNPWADPSTPTEQVPPYSGPPVSGPYPPGPYAGPPYGWPPAGGGHPWPYAWGGTGHPWWPMPPQGPRRPGQVVAAAVLAFVQAALVLVASIYVFMLATVLGFASDQSLRVPADVARLATEGRVLAIVQLVSAVLLVVAGVLALGRPRRQVWYLLLAALGLQLALAVYWAVRLGTVLGDVPGPDPSSAFLTMSLFFAAPPAVALGLVLLGPGRRWFAVRDPGTG